MTDDKLTEEEQEAMIEYVRPGSLRDQYNVYLGHTHDKFPKTFDEWLNT